MLLLVIVVPEEGASSKVSNPPSFLTLPLPRFSAALLLPPFLAVVAVRRLSNRAVRIMMMVSMDGCCLVYRPELVGSKADPAIVRLHRRLAKVLSALREVSPRSFRHEVPIYYIGIGTKLIGVTDFKIRMIDRITNGY